jgi:GNAT superfamily N-acetyltransferase
LTTAIQVRFAALGDYAQWLPLWEGYNRFYGRFDATALPEEITRMTWSRFFDAYEPMRALVAEDITPENNTPEKKGRLVGLAHYLFHRSTTTIEPTCYLQDLFTAEAARGKGVGRKLIEAVYEQARLAGVVNVYWRTHASNATARRLYDQVAEESGSLVYKKRLAF